MAVKANVRQRRQDRIKKLTDNPKNALTAAQITHYPAPESDRFASTMLPDDGRLDDPEFVWKHQYHQRWGGGSSSGGNDRWGEWMSPPTNGVIRGKFVVCLLLFAAIWGMFQLQHPWAERGQELVHGALTEEFQYEAIADWYEKMFAGAPSFIPALHLKKDDAVPVNANYYPPVLGKVAVPFTATHIGIEVETKSGAPVAVLDTGRVMFAGNTAETGYTIIVQHANRVQSVYGFMEASLVKKNDWVEGGEQIGSVAKRNDRQSGMLYLAIMQDKQYVDPVDVITFD